MKYIKKSGAPHEYRVWCRQVQGTQDADYRMLTRRQKDPLHLSLIEEQGWLCAYTMKRIGLASSHIEHIKPESLCRQDSPGSDLDYDNLVACFPREGMKRQHRYGAQLKDDWWENNGTDFISPLHSACEKRFQFDLDGSILAVKDHAGAKKTIEILKLDHEGLADDRKRVINEFIYGESVLSEAQALQSKIAICDRNAEGQFREFCVAIRDALDGHVKNLRKIARQKKFARQKKR